MISIIETNENEVIMTKFPMSVASYSFHGLLGEGKCDVFRYLTLSKDHYKVPMVDIWSGFLPTLDDDFISKVRSELDRLDLTLANLCVDGPHLWMDNADERAEHKKKALEYIRAAEKLGAKTIRIDFGGTAGHTMSEEAFDYIAATYREYAEICGNAGMLIGPENHWGWDNVPEYLEKVCQAVNHPAYGHLYHFRNFFDETERGEAYGIAHAMHTHIHAATVVYAKDVIRRLALSGYQGSYSIEHHSGHLEIARTDWQIATVRGLMAELNDEGLENVATDNYFSGIYAGK